MIGLNKFSLIYILLSSCLAILQQNKDPLIQLWNLTNHAIQSRQYGYQGNPTFNSGLIKNILPSTQNLLEAFTSIANNDDHHCVAKLLCEMTAGSLTPSGRQLSFSPQVQFDTDSLFSMLSSFETTNKSPILLLGRAALLGYTSKNNADSCTYAYPRCPKNPNVLLNYLNNHNGGFFRFFKGINSNQPNKPSQYQQNSQNYGLIQQRPVHFYRNNEERIVNSNNYEQISYLKFPDNDNSIGESVENGYINFPPKISKDETYRSGEKLNFPSDYEENIRQHRQNSQIAYPGRTGTGELKVDTSAFFDRHYEEYTTKSKYPMY